MPEIQIADKPTLDQVKALIGATGDGVGIVSLFGRLALLAAYVDQLEGFTDELEARLTLARAGKLDNLDALISSRAAAATALSTAIWTAARAGYLDSIPQVLGGTPYYRGIDISVPATTTLDVWSVSGSGCLDGLYGFKSNAVGLSYQVWIDGTKRIDTAVDYAGAGAYSYGLPVDHQSFLPGPVKFNASLVVKGVNSGGTASNPIMWIKYRIF